MHISSNAFLLPIFQSTSQLPTAMRWSILYNAIKHIQACSCNVRNNQDWNSISPLDVFLKCRGSTFAVKFLTRTILMQRSGFIIWIYAYLMSLWTNTSSSLLPRFAMLEIFKAVVQLALNTPKEPERGNAFEDLNDYILPLGGWDGEGLLRTVSQSA